MTFDIRPARLNDVEALRTLIGAMGYQPSSEEVRRRLQAIPESHVVYVAESQDEGIGWIHVVIGHSLIVGPRAEIAGLAVAPHVQGIGVGSALLAAAETWAAQHGVPTIYLRSGAERKDAHGFYLSRGYQAVKTQLALAKALPSVDGT